MNAATPPLKERIIAVTPDLIDHAGDGNAAIFLAQVLFWWKAAGRQKFYKFNAPCDHPLYRQGDSWMEELRFRRAMFCTARKRVAAKVRISCSAEIDAAFAEGALIVYGTDEHHLTWYIVNEAVIRAQHPQLFTRLFPNDPAPAAPIRKSRAPQQANPPVSSIPVPTGYSDDSAGSGSRRVAALPVTGTLHRPMQEACTRIPTEKTSQKTPESPGSTKLYKSKPTLDIPLPTNLAREGEDADTKDQVRTASAIFTALQQRGVQEDPARLIARRAVRSGLSSTTTLEIFDAHLLDAHATGAMSPMGVAVSRMVKNQTITPAPRDALYRVRQRTDTPCEEHHNEVLLSQATDSLPEPDTMSGTGVDGPKQTQSLWTKVLDDIKVQVTRATFEQRFKGTWLEAGDGTYVVCASDPATVDWLQHRLQRLVCDSLRRQVAVPGSVGFALR